MMWCLMITRPRSTDAKQDCTILAKTIKADVQPTKNCRMQMSVHVYRHILHTLVMRATVAFT